VARAFAADGASVFLAGRTHAPLEAVADEIAAAGRRCEAAQVDALDADAVEHIYPDVVRRTGRIDISLNVIGLGDAQGAPLVRVGQAPFIQPVMTAMQSHYLTATAAARHLAPQRSGVILAVTAQVARKPYPDIGGFGVA
jgi:3-oxoacyl-[acyl-carrier protein] reductase